MELMVGICWIVAGIAVVLYKFGQEKLDGGVIGGVTAVMIPVVALFLIWFAFSVSAYLGVSLVFGAIMLLPMWAWIRKANDILDESYAGAIEKVFRLLCVGDETPDRELARSIFYAYPHRKHHNVKLLLSSAYFFSIAIGATLELFVGGVFSLAFLVSIFVCWLCGTGGLVLYEGVKAEKLRDSFDARRAIQSWRGGINDHLSFRE